MLYNPFVCSSAARCIRWEFRDNVGQARYVKIDCGSLFEVNSVYFENLAVLVV